ncbi:hypothetical protein SAMN06265795_101658 [Noviherbaspirillum humi]|uniref:Lysylphosphatidylglycerol synthase TM region n=1 Tax=Noviherbaspirillum humi TaxID=1688639 RepID=A0A239CV77_9BURK|nr:lysylphosphatidylglycerol synthase transmembrane domain-containing protein [Noviherbaspirillum humi]SNS23762.1 hypothetical protein SAMN06265795_101658 [Noviherbaspirillum humi]
MNIRKAARFGLGLGLAALFAWMLVRQIRLDELRRAFEGVEQHWVAAALLSFVAGYVCRIQRWRLMLQVARPGLRWADCAGPFLASFAVNNVLPFRAGDVLRAFAFNRRLGVTSGSVLATLLVERLLDLLMVLVLFGAALAVFGLQASQLAGIGGATLILAGGMVMMVLLFPGLFSPILQAFGKVAGRVAPSLGVRMQEEIGKILSTLAGMARGGNMIRLIAWSAMAWLAEGGVFGFAALAIHSITMPSASWLALPIGTLATLIPSTPGYVGTFDYFTVHAMTALGNERTAAVAYALLVHALLWLPPTILGGLYLLMRPARSEKSLKGIQS